MPQYNKLLASKDTAVAFHRPSTTDDGRSLLPALIGYFFDMTQGHAKIRSFRRAVAAKLAAGLAALGLATGCAAPPRAPRLPMGSNAAAIQRDGKRLLAHLSPVEEDEAQPAGVAASHRTFKGDEQ